MSGWEEQGTLAVSDEERIRAHAASCQACAHRLSALLALFQRDARGTPLLDEDRPPAELGDMVMQRIGAASPRRSPSPAWWAAGAAACLFLFLGIGLGTQLLRVQRPDTEVVVRFELAAPGARSVALVGNFNGWDLTRSLLTDADKDGVWEITIQLKRNSTSLYNFVIDGTRWVTDPSAPARVDDGFGGFNSVMRL